MISWGEHGETSLSYTLMTMDHFHSFHTQVQNLANLNESIVNSHFPEELGRCLREKDPNDHGCHPPTGTGDDNSSMNKSLIDTEEAAKRGPPTSRPRLPMEVVELVLRNFTKPELLPLLQANRALHSVAVRLLYREIVDHDKPKRCVSLLRQLLRNPSVHQHIRKLDINISILDCPTANLYRLLHRLLKRTTGLTALLLEFSKGHSPVWILEGCAFKLKLFSTSMHCTPALAGFLDSQENIVHLTLRGFHSEALQSLPYIYMDIKHSLSPGLLKSRDSDLEQFMLEAGSLPRLTMFNAIHAGPAVVREVVKGRPVHTASIPLFSMNAYQSLDALRTSAVPLKRLSVISFDPNVPAFIFEQVAKRFSELEALHIVVLLAEFTNDLLMAACPHLHHFKRLKYITCVATSPEETSLAEEQEIAEKWHEECPTLRTIIFPRGRVWFQTCPHMPSRRSWECLDD